jgi:hypothetical protein
VQPVFTFLADLLPRPGDDPAALFARLADRVTQWVAAEYHGTTLRNDGVPVAPADGHTVSLAREAIDPAHDLLTLDWSQPGDADGVRLTCSVELARVPLGVQARVAVRAADGRAGVAPVRVDVYRPGVVDLLLKESDGLVGGQPVPAAVRRLTPPFVPGFVDDLLLDPRRALPVVVLTPHPQTGRPVVDPGRMLDKVYGLAHVAELTTKDTTFALTDRVGREWSCFHGAVRIYWPGMNPDDPRADFRRHPIFFPDHYPPGPETDTRLPRDVLRRLASAAHVRFADAPLVRLARAALDRKRQAAVQRQLSELKAGADEAREWLKQLDAAWQENRRLTDELELTRTELAELREELGRQREQWGTVSQEIADAKAEAGRQAAAAARFRQRLLTRLRKVAEAVELAREDYADTLEFLPSAVKSAAESPYQSPREVYDLFRALDEVMRTIRSRGQLGEPLYEVLRRYNSGFRYKDRISITSEGKYGDEYHFVYNGQRLLFENHVTLGKSFNPQECLSVHWLRDDAARQFVIGWCGKHLTNTRT